MALQLIWFEHKVLVRALGLELASLSFYLSDDLTGNLPDSLSLQIVVRLAGVQIGETTVQPLANGPVTIPLLAAIGGTLDGRVDDYRGIDGSGNATPWSSAVAVAFKITAIGDLTIPAATIAALVPVIGSLLKAALALVGGKVKISLAHEDTLIHLPRSA